MLRPLRHGRIRAASPPEKRYRGGSQFRRLRAIPPACRDQFIQLPECAGGKADQRQERVQVTAGGAPAEVFLDDPGERLSLPFAPRQGFIGFEVDRDRLDGHALIMHLPTGWSRRPVPGGTPGLGLRGGRAGLIGGIGFRVRRDLGREEEAPHAPGSFDVSELLCLWPVHRRTERLKRA